MFLPDLRQGKELLHLGTLRFPFKVRQVMPCVTATLLPGASDTTVQHATSSLNAQDAPERRTEDRMF